MVLNWPEVVENNNNVSKLIKIALGEWAENKEKNNIYKNTDTIGFDMPGVYNQNLRKEKEEKVKLNPNLHKEKQKKGCC